MSNKNLSAAILNGISPKQTAEPTFANAEEKTIVWKHRFNSSHTDAKAYIEERENGGFSYRIKAFDGQLFKTKNEAKALQKELGHGFSWREHHDRNDNITGYSVRT